MEDLRTAIAVPVNMVHAVVMPAGDLPIKGMTTEIGAFAF